MIMTERRKHVGKALSVSTLFVMERYLNINGKLVKISIPFQQIAFFIAGYKTKHLYLVHKENSHNMKYRIVHSSTYFKVLREI